ncbi:uncharacterized protein TRIADDRAFT_29750 [Trichoplax adhaerens]|uniref:F-box domain-containing protein n=1 Tax=Trichoplax adhaerens TaxID=10228 RepID=B3S5Y4_TRIAD|nr:hypothetical protein TRIADDRAFT_29750 [Trichoplax adhaerens]EDV21891.1 hypothetical protein TRIADDRAFT_29750 [Trichoplax adhaerens]|eukprot:XP_002115528.1 hypothetical protein TRIADDRAFT_29750 [Trichoplax adhaerens]
MDKTGQAPAPSKDYHQLLVTHEEIIWRWWKISMRNNAIVFPGETKIPSEDFDYDDRLQTEILRIFGKETLEEVRRLSMCKGDCLASLPLTVLMQIIASLPLEDILMLSQVNHYLRYVTSLDSLWKEVYINLCGAPNEEIRSYANENGWKKTLFTDKLKLRVQLARRRKDMESPKANTFITSSDYIK